MCLLEGGMALTDNTGFEHRFTASDVLLELPDTVSAWTSTTNVRKSYCILAE
jgi:uncharacterized cupin superfamily protein